MPAVTLVWRQGAATATAANTAHVATHRMIHALVTAASEAQSRQTTQHGHPHQDRGRSNSTQANASTLCGIKTACVAQCAVTQKTFAVSADLQFPLLAQNPAL